MVAKLAVVDPPRKQRKPITGTVLRLKQMMASTSRVSSFTLPDYPPGIAPKKARMAMDDAFGAVNAWGNQSAFAAAAAINYQSAALEGLAFPGYAFLSELAQRPEYRRISEIIATEMTRKWIKITSTSKDDDSKIEQIKIIEAELKRLNVRDCFQKCTELDGYFGRAHLYIDTGSVDDREELKIPIGDGSNDISMIKMAGKTINYIQAIEPVWTYPTAYNSIDPLKQDWYDPSTWFVFGKEIHKTRLLKFVGRQVPDMLKPAYSFGGLSMSQMAIPYVNNWLRTRQSVADIIHSFSVFVLKTNLSESLSEEGEELFQRAEAFNMFRDNKGVFLLDKEGEDFANVSAPLGSLDHLQAQSQEHLSSVSGIPLVKLTGISPSGLNATSEFEMRSFYDWIHAFQEKLYRPNLTVIINMIQLSKVRKIDPDIVFEFEPLWSLDEKGQAEVNQIKSQSGIAMVEAGILSQEEERKRVATDPDSDYSSIDVEDVPELRQEEEQGLEPHGGAAKIAEGAAAQQGEVQPVGEGEGSEDEEGQDDEPFATGELRPDYIDEEAYQRNAQPDHPGRGSPKNRKIAEAALKLREKPGYKGELHDDYLEGKNPLLDKDILKERAALRKEATDDEPMPPVRERKMNPEFLKNKHQTDPDYLKKRSQQRDEAAFDASFEESKHPRGQPGNAGQFGAGGGGQQQQQQHHAMVTVPFENQINRWNKQLSGETGGSEQRQEAVGQIFGVLHERDKVPMSQRRNWDFVFAATGNNDLSGAGSMSVENGVATIHHLGSLENGVGTKIMGKLVEEAKRKKARSMVLDAREDNRGFYEKLGFVPISNPDETQGELRMKLSLDSLFGIDSIHDSDPEWHPFIGLGMDEANFKESEHPRDTDGKFAPYQHSLGLQGESGKKLKQDLETNGFKKAPKTSSGKYKYHNDKGAALVVEPPEGEKFKGKPGSLPWSTNWTLYPYADHPNPIKGKGNKALSEALGGLSESGPKEAPKPKEEFTNADIPGSNDFVKTFVKHGFTGGGVVGQNYVYTKGESKVKLHWDEKEGKFDKWLSISPGHLSKEGEGVKSLEMLLSGESIKNANVANVPDADFESWPAEKPKQQTPEPHKGQTKSEGMEILYKIAAGQPKPTGLQKSAMSAYVGSGYHDLNGTLRDGSPHSSQTKQLQDFLNQCQIPEPITVWRTVGGTYAKILKSIMIDGTKFQDKGFSSTTVKPDFNFKSGPESLKFEISVPKGANGAHVNNFHEAEVLFKAGTKYRVISYDGDKFAKLEMLLE